MNACMAQLDDGCGNKVTGIEREADETREATGYEGDRR